MTFSDLVIGTQRSIAGLYRITDAKKLYLIVTFCSPLANFIIKAHSFCGLHNFAPRRGIFKNAA